MNKSHGICEFLLPAGKHSIIQMLRGLSGLLSLEHVQVTLVVVQVGLTVVKLGARLEISDPLLSIIVDAFKIGIHVQSYLLLIIIFWGIRKSPKSNQIKSLI